jgi:hypothetical protein
MSAISVTDGLSASPEAWWPSGDCPKTVRSVSVYNPLGTRTFHRTVVHSVPACFFWSLYDLFHSVSCFRRVMQFRQRQQDSMRNCARNFDDYGNFTLPFGSMLRLGHRFGAARLRTLRAEPRLAMQRRASRTREEGAHCDSFVFSHISLR